MKQLKSSIKKVTRKAKYAVATLMLAMSNPTAFAANDVNINSTLQKLVTFVFSIMTVGGVLSIAYGSVQIVKAFSNGGADGDPHGMAKGVSFVIGGLVMVCVRAVVKAIIGTDPSNMTFVEGV